ncbi:30S ribosomal protein S18 [Striga asiatica]|uniref:30S ribosomal protein S18 n=1 Tax=Striga asiatica TaxID=4170 RepID=A0A5A7R7B5_STRAF|nr:30S ribosomal protein S18 [Striga asiatica]
MLLASDVMPERLTYPSVFTGESYQAGTRIGPVYPEYDTSHSDRQQRIHNLANKEHNTTGLLPYYKEERMVSYKVKHVHGLAVHRTSNHVDTSRSCCSLRALFVHLYVCLMKKERDFE